MRIPDVVDSVEHGFLRAVYEVADGKAKWGVAFVEAQARSGQSEGEADRACDFWTERGILEFPSLNHVALTHLGLRRAQRLAERGWRPYTPF